MGYEQHPREHGNGFRCSPVQQAAGNKKYKYAAENVQQNTATVEKVYVSTPQTGIQRQPDYGKWGGGKIRKGFR